MYPKWIYCKQKKIDIGINITYGGFNQDNQPNKTITIKADQTRIDTILNMEPPTTKTQVQSFLGMIKVLHNWYPTMTIQTKHIREMTHENNHWNSTWTIELDSKFKQIKQSIAQNLQLNPYNPDLPTQLFTDASKEWDFGFILSQTDSQQTNLINCG